MEFIREEKAARSNIDDMTEIVEGTPELENAYDDIHFKYECMRNCAFGAESVNIFDKHSSKASNSYRIQHLKTENEKLRAALMCRVCKILQVQTLNLPCCHIVCCEGCADACENCPLCQAKILGTARIFLV
jgi:Zinc finger, C3HC4 type (RING finger)